jgi:hypothetical protein
MAPDPYSSSVDGSGGEGIGERAVKMKQGMTVDMITAPVQTMKKGLSSSQTKLVRSAASSRHFICFASPC